MKVASSKVDPVPDQASRSTGAGTDAKPAPASEAESLTELHRPRNWKRRRNAVGFFTFLTAVFIGALAVLVVQGYDAATSIKGGATAEVNRDPTSPGFLAGLDPSPVHLLAITDSEDVLSAWIVLVPTVTGGGGSYIWSLGEVVVDRDGEPIAISTIYAEEGIGAARLAFETELGFGTTDVTIVGPTEMETLMATIKSLTIDIPDSIIVDIGDERVEAYGAGELTLQAEDVTSFLTMRGADEVPENRSLRAESVFSAMTQDLAKKLVVTDESGNIEIVDGDEQLITDSGIDLVRVLASMGASSADFIILPTAAQEFEGSYIYNADPEAAQERLRGVVSLPVSAFPGQRPRMRLLNGTTKVSAAKSVASVIAAQGGEVLLVGNAESLDLETTTVVYAEEDFAPVAESVADLLGVSAERVGQMSDASDIDVTLGADANS